MKLWIDGQCLQTESRLRGIGRYVQELIRSLSEGAFDVELAISFNAALTDSALGARDYVARFIKPENIHMWNGVAQEGEAMGGYTARRRLSEIALGHHVACLRPDIALSASPFEGLGEVAVPLMPKSVPGTPVASIFYDAIPHRFPEKYLQRQATKDYYNRRLVSHADFDLNLCISEYSQKEISELTGNDRSVNISAGISRDLLELIDQAPEKPRAQSVLYVGALDWRKNVRAIVLAFAQLPADLLGGTVLVLAGDHNRRLLVELKSLWEGSALPANNLRILGHVSDEELVALYRGSGVVVQPSFLEGFGLTALEAMASGVPVIASNTGALPEVVGDPESLFDPSDPSDLARRLTRLLRNPEKARAAVEAGRLRSAGFTWRRSAEIATRALRATVEAYRSQTGATQHSRTDLRQLALQALGRSEVPSDIVAGALARAEPLPSHPSRLLVDATTTIKVDLGTGIQRVVKKIADGLLQMRDARVSIIHGDGGDGFFHIDDLATSAVDRAPENKICFFGDDTVLMLDSSWEFHKAHLPVLIAGRLRGADVVSCLYDTVPLRYSAMCDPNIPPVFAGWFQSALTYSTGFVCISRAVADELHRLLEGIGFPREMRIGYWRLGADFGQSAAPVERKPRGVRPNFLMVGTIEPRKGHMVALKAFETLWREGMDFDVTIVGRPGWGAEHVISQILDHGEFGKRLLWREKVSDEELEGHYGRADALVAASFAEGFGLPIVEARHFGKHAFVSDIPVFREITGGSKGVTFFKTGSASSLSAVLRAFVSGRAQARDEEIDRPREPSWADSALQLYSLLRSEEWYRIYRPKQPRPYVSVFDHGATTMSRKLEVAERKHRMELVGEPYPCDEGRVWRYIVRLTNLSVVPWSSVGAEGTQHGIFMSYRVRGAGRTVLQAGNPRMRIPFVLVPDDQIHLAVDVPSDAKAKGGAFVEIEMMQEGEDWWGNPLVLPL